MPYSYNPLLKDCLQKSPDTAQIESEIANLQQKKITKFFSANDILQDSEIAQYQGIDDVDNGLINGYFYKSVYSPISLPIGTPYLEYSKDSDTSDYGNISYNSFIVNYGDKLFLIDDNVNVNTFRFHNNYQTSSLFRYGYITDINDNINVGDKAFYFPDGTHCYFTKVFPPPVMLSDGNTFIGPKQGGRYSDHSKVSKYLSTRGVYYYLINYVPYYILLKLNNNLDTIVDWQPICLNSFTSSEDVSINVQSLNQVNTQPQISDIEPSENGLDVDTNLNVSGNVAVSGDLTVNGTQTVVITQEVDSENDNINLRYNNPLGLENGAESGLKVLNYDGNNTNCFLGVDNQGWARVGDENGTLQKLATIEENPTNGELVAYNTTTKQLESKTLSVTSTTAAGLCPQLPNDSTTTKYLREDGTWVKPPNTTYSSKTAASGGTDVSLCTTGEKYTWNNKSDLAIGTSASTAAAGNHTHSLSIATDSGTNQLTLAASTKYKLTAGGKTFIFTTPASGAPTVTSGTDTLSSGGYAWAKCGNVATLMLSAGVVAGTYTLPSGVPKPNTTLNTVTNGAKLKLTTTQLIVTSGYQANECITYICQ